MVTETIDDDFNFKYQLGCASQTVSMNENTLNRFNFLDFNIIQI